MWNYHDRPDDELRLTLNRPAVREFWAGSVNGIRLRSQAGKVSFLPVSDAETVSSDNRPRDFVDARPRTRGGVEFGILGLLSSQLAETLRRVITPEKPYFLLHREANGWITATHYDRSGDPPRTGPAMRVWLRQPALSGPSAVSNDPAAAYAEIVRHASEVLLRWSDGRHLGRVPAQVEAAQQTMAGLAVLIHEVQHHLTFPEQIDVRAIRIARDTLSEALTTFERRATERV